jgi:prevent-host-death family protein
MERIGVRELRQHASRYLARVARGERIEVTDRGRPVAMLVPMPRNTWDELLASGQVKPPDEEGDLLDEPPVDYGIDASGELRKMRELERW